jgi:Zn-finger nucleic acid-binding protein
MREVEKHGVHLDVCPSCKGVWLDRGELEKLIEIGASGGARSETGPSGSGAARHDDRHEDHDHEHRERDGDRDRSESGNRGSGERKRKGSWLGDILGGFGGGD